MMKSTKSLNPYQSEGGDDNRDEIEQRIGDDKINQEDVRFSHHLEMVVASEIVQLRRNSKRRKLCGGKKDKVVG